MTLPAAIADWPSDIREDYEERAAIVEALGARPRKEAERIAEGIVRAKLADVRLAHRAVDLALAAFKEN